MNKIGTGFDRGSLHFGKKGATKKNLSIWGGREAETDDAEDPSQLAKSQKFKEKIKASL